jgi:DNA-directed RNA polymerase subunit beta'
MAHLDHTAAYEDLKENVLAGIRDTFPINGNLQTVELHGLTVKEGDLHADDIKGQHDAKVSGKTWASTVYGDISLRDNKTNEVISRRNMRLAEIPMVTRRRSHIIDGKEYQVDNQWQLKPGIYAKRRVSGELEAAFNVPNRRSFDITFNPESKQFMMQRGGSKAIPVYPILKTMGIDDDALESAWGKDILSANKNASGVSTGLEKFYRVDKKHPPKTKEEAEQYLIDTMKASSLRPDATKATLGKPFSNVTGESIRLATAKLLAIQAGAPEDDRDSLVYKDLRSTGDFAYDKLRSPENQRSIRSKVVRKMFSAKDVRDVIKFDMFNEPVRQTFYNNAAARTASQVNPVEMIAGAQQTTVMGPGGVQSQNAVDKMVGLKFVNPSHMGFLDPVRTPESEKSGVVLRLPMGLRKHGKDPIIPLYNLRTGRTESVDPAKFAESVVVLPDQVEWKGGKPKPKSSSVKVSKHGNEPGEAPFKDADYVMRHPSQLFSITTNLIPFLGNNSGNRATYAGQHIEQAISLQDREAPLVQVGTGSEQAGIRTFEELLGRQASHQSPGDGKVTDVKSGAVLLHTKDGKREVQLYNNFPLNDPKAVLHSTPIVKAGQSVKAGQVVADTNFTKDGTLALGTNLRVAYIPYKGYNFEDGVVISESAAKKLTSEHMHKPEVSLDKGVITNPRKFLVQHPDTFGQSQFKKLDDDGVVRVGQKVQTGDPLVLAMRPFQAKDRMSLQAIGRALSGRHTDVTLRWQSDHPGEVVAVHKDKDKIVVHVRTQEPMQVGDKIAGRHGNKGIVTKIVPDKMMPHTPDGKHIEIALNPSGVPGRMNVGQVLETAAAKIAEKTGKTYVVENFSGDDQLAKVKKELKSAGLTDQEELHDPSTGVHLGKALVGPQYMLKLMHQIDKKHSARSGMALPGGEEDPEAYDSNLLPAQGGKTGGQSIGSLDMYTLLAHGAKANIREMQTWKSEGPDPQPDPAKRWNSQHPEVWSAIQLGEPLPPPRPTFAFRKFTDMLRATGINIEKKGHHLQLLPMTNKQVLAMSSGELKKPGEVVYPSLDVKTGEPKPKAGGIFDERATGGHGGRKWSHINLAEPVPNPIFEKAIQRITGLSEKEYFSIVQGKKALTKTGKEVDLDTPGAVTGGPAIVQILEEIDVPKALAAAEKELSNTAVPSGYAHRAATPKIDKLVKKVKYLRALEQANLKPSDAYVIRNLPVIPPAMRPISTLKDGSVKWGDLNELYKNFGTVNTAMKDPSQEKMGDDQKMELRESLYDGVRALMGVGTHTEQTHKGIIHQIAGDPAKEGYFQNVLMSRRQDMSMRSTIVPEPALDLDEVGLPRSKALTLYKPFVVRKLVEMGSAPHVLEARKMVQNNDPAVNRALELVVQDRPVLLKRDPALHRHSVQAFKPKLVSGKAIQIHPLVTSGYNADFDGDTMSAYVPISDEAVKEARNMMPSANLYSEASGRVVFTPTLESALGLYKLSRKGPDSGKRFKSPVEVLNAVNDKKLNVNDQVTLGNIKTTPGRILLASALPEQMQSDALTSLDKPIDKRGLNALFRRLAEQHKDEYGDTANKLKDLGNGASYGAVPVFHDLKGQYAISAAERPKDLKYVSMPTHSLSLDDFEPDRETRDKVLGAAEKEVEEINKSSLSKREKERRSVETWISASKKMDDAHMKKIDASPSNLALMLKAGVKPSDTQYKQMVLAPVLMADASGHPINQPIKKSYSEGLDVAGYWTQQQGARRGTVMKVQEVRDPGTFTKRMIQTTMGAVVVDDDCGTNRGIAMSIADKNVHDRRLATDVNFRGAAFSAGTLLTPQIVDRIKSADKSATVVVRSPLKCEHSKGICRKCAGLRPNGDEYEIGTNVGVIASQALGERSVQLTMKAFHSGGVVQSAGASRAVNDFERVKQLTDLTESIPNSATIAMRSGKIDKIEKDTTGVAVWIGGVRHHIGKDRSGAPLHEVLPHAGKLDGYKPWRPPKEGMKIRAGETLSDPNRTSINPRDLYRATNDMETVQNFLVDELSNIYGDDVRRQHVETVVHAMGNLTKIRDPGDAPGLVRGEFQSASAIRAINRELVKQGKKPVEHSPVLKGVDNMPLSVQEDWMAKLQHIKLKSTLLDAAALGARSNLHGTHPVPGAAYGAEFGLTSKDSLKPGYQHLKDVPRYAY